MIYQAPDLGSVLNSLILTGVNHLQKAFEEAREYPTYHPSQWDFGKDKDKKLEPAVSVKSEAVTIVTLYKNNTDQLVHYIRQRF